MKVLFVLTYYRPHVSGLTIYVQRLAEGMAARGFEVTVLTSRYDAALPEEEPIGGVRVVRVPVWRRIGKGVLMPGFVSRLRRLAAEHDLVSIHLPQFEAALATSIAKRAGRPVVLTYHCDLLLPRGLFNRLTQWAAWRMHDLAARNAGHIVAYTEDYAAHSPFLRRFREKVTVIAPPVEVAAVDAAEKLAFERRHSLDGGPHIGMAARLATEKGVEVLLEAMLLVWQRFPDARVLFAGPFRDIVGERAYAKRLEPAVRAAGSRWTFLGALQPREMTAFFSACDVTVLPSLNATESFGLVQVESMLCGTPVVASSLPGVRVAISQTGMGELARPGDAVDLAGALCRVLDNPSRYRRPAVTIEDLYGTERAVEEYSRFFTSLI